MESENTTFTIGTKPEYEYFISQNAIALKNNVIVSTKTNEKKKPDLAISVMVV